MYRYNIQEEWTNFFLNRITCTIEMYKKNVKFMI